jgi:GntR family transcriptional regulator, transcriptional repressor for pyruvate dehydrogenase complex
MENQCHLQSQTPPALHCTFFLTPVLPTSYTIQRIGPTTGPRLKARSDNISHETSRPIREGLEPVRRTKVYAEVASQIHRLIAQGRLEPGDRLPPERELAEMFGVSRTSVRDAIRVLEMRGLVEPRHGDGTVVKQIPIDALVTPLAEALAASKDLTADLFDMRRMLEPPLARVAALRATDEDITAMEHILSRQAERVRAGGIAIEEDNAFHYRIGTAAKNQVVLRLMDVVMDLLRESRARSLQGPGRAEKSLNGHRRILSAISDRAPDAAAEAMRLHIEEIEQVLSLPGESGSGGRARAGTYDEKADRVSGACRGARSTSGAGA